MKTVTFEITTKKDTTQKVCFLVEQSHPFPTIVKNGTSMQWGNFEAIFPVFQRPAQGLANSFTCYLLRSDVDPSAIPDEYNRGHFAGYVPYQSKGNDIAPGAINYRGKSLGEMRIGLENNLGDYPMIRVRESDNPSPSEREFIMEQIIPKLVDFIHANKAQLHADAKAKTLQRMRAQISAARTEIAALESKIAEAVF